MNEPAFVGESRKALVDGLLALFDRVLDEGTPLWVSLEAPSGWGKTRVAQELYRRLATERQGEPRYWPPSILGTEDSNNALSIELYRKRVHPHKVRRSANSVPSWIWWGVSCSTRGGMQSSALMEDFRQLRDHEVFFLERYLQSAGVSELVREAAKRILTLAKEKSVEGAVSALKEFLKLGPVPGLVVDVLRRLVSAEQRRRSRKALLRSETVIGEQISSQITDEVMLFLGQFVHSELPLVLFIEDFHLADALLVELVDRIIRAEMPAVIITSALPGTLDEALTEAQALLKEAARGVYKGRLVRVRHDRPTPPDLPSEAHLDTLDRKARSLITKSYFPHISQATEKQLLDTYENPLALELACLALGGPTSSVLDVDLDDRELPQRVRGLYQRLWEETLSGDLQAALVLAAWQTPTEIVGDHDWAELLHDGHWDHEVLCDTIREVTGDRAEGLLASLESDATVASWVRVDRYPLRAFIETVQGEVAASDPGDQFYSDPEPVRKRLYRHLAERAASLEDSGDTEITMQHARTLVALYAKNLAAASYKVLEAIALLVSELAQSPLEFKWVRLLAAEAENVASEAGIDIDDHMLFAVRANNAHVLGDLGEWDEALGQLRELVADTKRVLRPDHPDALAARRRLGRALVRSGDFEDGLAVLREVAADSERVLGPDHPEVFGARRSHAAALTSLGDVENGLAVLREVAADSERVLGPDHPEVFGARRSLAAALTSLGDVEDGLAVLREVAADSERVLGPDHPLALDARKAVGEALTSLGDFEDGLAVLREVAADSERVFGPDHPLALAARRSIAGALVMSGDVKAGLDLFRKLVVDAERLLGPRNIATLVARGNLVGTLMTSDDWDEALRLLPELIAGRESVLGPDNKATLMARKMLLLAQAMVWHGDGTAGHHSTPVTDS